MNDIVLEYRKFAKNIALKVGRRCPKHIDVDDLIGDAMVGLIEAARRYDPSSGASAKTFVYWRIHGAIMDNLRAGGRRQEETGYETVLLEVPDECDNAHDIAEANEERRLMNEAIASLDERDRAMLTGMAAGRVDRAMARDLGMSRSRLTEHRHRAIERLRARVVDMTTRQDTMST